MAGGNASYRTPSKGFGNCYSKNFINKVFLNTFGYVAMIVKCGFCRFHITLHSSLSMVGVDAITKFISLFIEILKAAHVMSFGRTN